MGCRLNTKVEPRKVAVKDLVVDLSDGVGLTSKGYGDIRSANRDT